MPRIEEKKRIVAELEEKLRAARAVVFVDYRGLNVAEATQLRRTFRSAGAEFKVVKNTLARLAAARAEVTGVEEFLVGPTALAFSFEDPVAAAKVLVDFIKNVRPLEIKGGLVEGRVLGPKEVRSLAELPGRGVLISQVLRGLQAPLAGLQGVLQAMLSRLVLVLKAIQEKKAA